MRTQLYRFSCRCSWLKVCILWASALPLGSDQLEVSRNVLQITCICCTCFMHGSIVKHPRSDQCEHMLNWQPCRDFGGSETDRESIGSFSYCPSSLLSSVSPESEVQKFSSSLGGSVWSGRDRTLLRLE